MFSVLSIYRVSIIFILIFSMSFVLQAFSEEYEHSKSFINRAENWYKFQGNIELGFLDVLSHTIQFGSTGTKFDYVDEGNQNVLFPFTRMTAEINMSKKHNIIFLIQPIDIRTKALLERDIIIDDLTFPKDTPIDLRYGFTFYRLSYLYDFWKQDDKELGLGLSLQIRNATIDFASADGKLFRTNGDIGPVPIFKFRLKYPFGNGMWIGTEADGFYASGRYITGSTNDFEGAILDASLRMGFELTNNLDTFLNIRYIGGGAKGTDENKKGPGDGFTDNWLKTLAISLGFYIR